MKYGYGKLTEKTGVNRLIAVLDKLYLKGERSQGHEERPSGMSIFEYVIKFEQLYFKG